MHRAPNDKRRPTNSTNNRERKTPHSDMVRSRTPPPVGTVGESIDRGDKEAVKLGPGTSGLTRSVRKGLGRSPSRKAGHLASPEPRRAAFESGNPRDAYSSVHHLKGNLDSLSFAIGLREGTETQGALERLLPMLKIQPRPETDGRKRGNKERERGYMECDHPDCIAREEKIRKLQELIAEEQESYNKLASEIEALNDRHNRAAMEMETLDNQIDDAIAQRVEMDNQNKELQIVVDEADSRNRQLQLQADTVRAEVLELTKRMEEREKDRRDQELLKEMLASSKMVFRPSTAEEAGSEEVRAVRELPDFA